jgi:rhodanese-related sulfurtransferase
VRKVLLEGALVAAIGAALAFAANALSPRGLKLGKNYFPGAQPSLPSPGAATPQAASSLTNNSSPSDLLAAKLQKDGLQLADTAQAIRFFDDPLREQDGIIFIDARDDQQYQAGHIPGAYQFNRFHPENYLANVVQVCLTAQQIVFYCNGGDCEDSEHSAIYLRDSLHIPKEKVFVYGGGITEWTAKRLPVEIGARNSGQITNAEPQAAASRVGAANR